MCEYESLQENILSGYDGFYFSLCWLVTLFSFFLREGNLIKYFLMLPKYTYVLAHTYLHNYRYDKCMCT